MASQERSKVLICYSPNDRKYKQEAERHLTSVLGAGNLVVCEAPEGSQSDDWRTNAEAVIVEAKFAVLLGSSDFLNSPYFNEVLLPSLLVASNRAGLRIFSVSINASPFQKTPLARFLAHSPSQTLSKMSVRERAEVWERIVRSIKTSLAPDFPESATTNNTISTERERRPPPAGQPLSGKYNIRAEQAVGAIGPGAQGTIIIFGTSRSIITQAPLEPPHFAAFSPREVMAETWSSLLAYVHIASALEQVRRDARKFQPELGERPREVSSVASQSVARGTEISFVPSGQGITFNPARVSFTWLEDWQRANFRFLVSKALAGSAAIGEIMVYAGPLIVATLMFGVLVEERPIPEPERVPVNEVSSRVYQRIFTSYSHKDTPVVLACRNTYKGLGLEVLIDLDNLRSGQVWNDELLRMIDRSDVFQLFWSPRSAQSEYVRQEWTHALKRNQGVGFIRPVYWELPLVAPPQELSHLHFAYIPLPKLDVPMSAYDQAIQTDPINAIAYHAKGDALSEQQRYQEALPYYDRAAQLDPGYAPTWSNKGNALYMLGRCHEALASLDQAIQAQPENALAYLRKVAALAKLQRYDEALVACDQVIRLQPNDASGYNNRANTLLMLERCEEAVAAYQQAIQLNPAYGLSYKNLSMALERLGRRSEATQAYHKARQLGVY
jgi:tetratricopeptide (TPR) repeat protein